ncbi:hypothetical protein [Amycolatopsis japonica]
MTPADELRAAAAKLREMAAAATQPRKPEYGWDFLDRDELRDPSYTDIVCSQNGGIAAVASFVDWPDAAWIALMGPNVAEPLASWLEWEGNRRHKVSTLHSRGILGGSYGHCSCGDSVIAPDPQEPGQCGRLSRALVFARSVLGEKP